MTDADLPSRSRRALAKCGLGLAVGFASTRGFAKAFEGYEPKTFTRRELLIIKALMSRLIPADDEAGGAIEAGAHVYLDQALGAHHARHLPIYRDALAELDRWARRTRAADFAEMSHIDVDALITRMEKGELEGTVADGGTAFFSLIRQHTLEGFLSDPMYGGNQDFIGWQVIGYNGVQLAYSRPAQELNGPDERDARSIAAFGGSPLR